ncbi:iron-sulfur protein [Pseudoclavibacter endophyticus]|uniref:Cytochrome bc1 complex Rieske iron-sulfur subunit n=1 Tax=Pseudoclavibacter endophyticus TaxID=1778590 RepID=A0A6H9WST2_9MICO|nr:Rieske (2Fe-2S) protein [Pseudoclavibacter endophyticus]KAB1649755.1 Rieske (2Fe-2S) protein [Pseudoclavibacter endophyticus]GGA59998.1 iron-sulfur protein [Pseudoclavibacter endophyticus]
MIERLPSIHDALPRGAARPVSRRSVAIAGGSVAVASVLAACAGNAPGDDGGVDAATGGPGEDATAGGAAGGEVLATVSLAEVPVRGGLIVSEVPLVVTQPTEGDVRAFSGVCTHQGCAVASVSSRGVMCPCHSSLFDLADGSPIGGPATEPLRALSADVSGDSVTVTLAG